MKGYPLGPLAVRVKSPGTLVPRHTGLPSQFPPASVPLGSQACLVGDLWLSVPQAHRPTRLVPTRVTLWSSSHPVPSDSSSERGLASESA